MPDTPPPPEPDPDPDRWGLVIRPEPGDVPAAARMRQWLKVGLRRFGLRCESVTATVPERVVFIERPKPKRKPARPSG